VQVSRCRGRPRKGADEPLQVPSLAAPPYDSRCPRQCRSTNLSLPVRFGEIQCVSVELGDITGFYMIDEEGVLQSVDVGEEEENGETLIGR